MTQPESGPASNVPHQPPIPLAPPGGAFPQPPAALLEPDPAPRPGSGPATGAEVLDPAPRAPRVRAAARDILRTLALTSAVYCVLLVMGIIWMIVTWDDTGLFPLVADWSLVVIPVTTAILQTRRIRSGQQTTGKRKMRISIVDARTGRAPTSRQAVIRTALLWFCVLSTVGALTLAWDLMSALRYASDLGVAPTDPYAYSTVLYGLQLFVPSQLGFVAPFVWIGTLISISLGNRRTPWDRAAGTTVVTAQSVWWAENDMPNPRIVAEATAARAAAATLASA